MMDGVDITNTTEMASRPTVCLNMIVKNEEAIIERSLLAALPYISCAYILDTGSTDRTVELINSLFTSRGVPCVVVTSTFVDFAHSRNEALDGAVNSNLTFTHLLFLDADMELQVRDGHDVAMYLGDPSFNAFSIRQRAGLLSYWNTRLVRRDAGAKYVGVTHEYIDVPDIKMGRLEQVEFIDHACGSNRVDKYERDARLLIKGLEEEPNNSRYMFYLAQTYREMGKFEESIQWYEKRRTYSDFPEESWYSKMMMARAYRGMADREMRNAQYCQRVMADDPEYEVRSDGTKVRVPFRMSVDDAKNSLQRYWDSEDRYRGKFIKCEFEAWNERPHRSEPLHDLVVHYRERGLHSVAMMLIMRGMGIPFPEKDLLFVEEYVYKFGFKQELSICGFYDTETRVKRLSGQVCEQLASSREIPPTSRLLARNNLFYYATKLEADVKPPIPLPSGATDLWHPMNPSVYYDHDDAVLYVLLRTVNYTINADGSYSYVDTGIVNTVNFLQEYDPLTLELRSSKVIDRPIDMPRPTESMRILGFEDCRLFKWRGELWVSATLLEQDARGRCEIVLSRIGESDVDGHLRFTDWSIVSRNCPHPEFNQKNWMPIVDQCGERLRFLYTSEPVAILDETGVMITTNPSPLALDNQRGGPPLIGLPVRLGGGYLGLTHEVVYIEQRRRYLHRWFKYSSDLTIETMGSPFYFIDKEIEFAVGLTMMANDTVVVSFGFMDREARLAFVKPNDVDVIKVAMKRIEYDAKSNHGRLTSSPNVVNVDADVQLAPMST